MGLFKTTPEWLRDFQFWVRRKKAGLPNSKVSNFDEQNIIDKYVDRLDITNRTVVDIGAGDGIRSSNTYHLFASGWRGVGLEVDEAKIRRLTKTYRPFPDVAASGTKISLDNATEVLSSFSIEPEFGVLSLDIDGNDYWVLDAILSKFRPRLVVSEYNEKIPPPLRFVVKYDPEFQLRHHFFGYSIAKLKDLLDKYSYVLLEVEYNNVFIAPEEIAGGYSQDIVEAYRSGYADRPDRKDKFPGNANMEPLQTLDPAEAVKFLENFYDGLEGKYQLELDH